MQARRIVGNILVFLAVAFTAYLSVIMLRRISAVVLKDTYVQIFRNELIVCAFFIVFALDVRFGFFTKLKPAALKAVGWCLRAVVVLATLAFLMLIGKVVAGSFVNTQAPATHAIVLGLALENGKPVPDLISRLDTAEKYLRDNPEATLVLTGGNPDKSGLTEAGAMRNILLERGVPEERMVLEDQAKSTRDNFKNAAELVDPGEPVVLISSNYHMDRAVRTAKSAGFTNVLRLPAPSSLLNYGANVMWEVVLQVNELMPGRRSPGQRPAGAPPRDGGN